MLLLIDNYDSFTYNLYQVLSTFYPNVKVIRNDALSMEEFKKLDFEGLIISPGPGWPKDAGLTIPLIQEFASKVPILGVCLGHQAITEAFGGKITYVGKIFHGKSTPVYHSGTGIFKGVTQPFEAGRYHSLVAEIDSFPKDLKIEAKTDDEKIMALRHIEYPCWGVQFHPESILTPEGPKIIENFINLIFKDREDNMK